MFNLPSYRVRAYLRGLRRAKQEQESRPRPKLHLKRTTGEIRLGDGFGRQSSILVCRVVLNDFSPEGIYIFSEVPLDLDTVVSLTIESPRRIFFKGYVVWCKRLSLHQNVVSSADFAYRVAIRFIIQSEQEREELRSIYRDLLKNHLSHV